MASITSETPPANTDPELASYLDRTQNSTSLALGSLVDLTPIDKLPDPPRIGMLYYFSKAIPLHGQITQEGLYLYKDYQWVYIA